MEWGEKCSEWQLCTEIAPRTLKKETLRSCIIRSTRCSSKNCSWSHTGSTKDIFFFFLKPLTELVHCRAESDIDNEPQNVDKVRLYWILPSLPGICYTCAHPSHVHLYLHLCIQSWKENCKTHKTQQRQRDTSFRVRLPHKRVSRESRKMGTEKIGESRALCNRERGRKCIECIGGEEWRKTCHIFIHTYVHTKKVVTPQGKKLYAINETHSHSSLKSGKIIRSTCSVLSKSHVLDIDEKREVRTLLRCLFFVCVYSIGTYKDKTKQKRKATGTWRVRSCM